MKILYYILVILLLPNCSFDNKSVISKKLSEKIKKTNKNFKDFKKIFLENENFFNEVIEMNKDFKFFLHHRHPQLNGMIFFIVQTI